MKLPFWATFLTLIGVMILCSLGSWQLKRLVWKQAILTSIDAQNNVDAAQVALKPSDLLVEDYIRRGYVTGIYDHSKEFLIYNRTLKGIPGYHVFTPLTLGDAHKDDMAQTILVNRGYIPIEAEREEGYYMFRPEGIVKVSGVLRHEFKENMFVPQNHIEKDIWYRIDPAQMARAKQISAVASQLFYAEHEHIKGRTPDQHYPIAIDGRVTPNNNHAQYAFFWFAMAVAMIGVYVARFIWPQISARKA